MLHINKSLFPILVFVFSGIIIFILFRYIHKFSRTVKLTNKSKQQLQRNIPYVEILVWLIFLSWSIGYFLYKNDVFAVVISVIILLGVFWFSRYALKNIVAGFIFRSTSGFFVDDQIEVNNIFGRIVKLSYLFVEIESSKGNQLQIPYSQIEDKIRKKSTSGDLASGYSFEIEIEQKADFEKITKLIEQTIISSPYSALNKWPKIEITEQTDKHKILEITVFALNKKYHQIIEDEIRNIY